MNNSTETELMWFEMLKEDSFIAHYVDDATIEVFVLAAAPQLFARVREDDGQTIITTLSEDRAELIHGEARLAGVPAAVIAAVVEVMLGCRCMK